MITIMDTDGNGDGDDDSMDHEGSSIVSNISQLVMPWVLPSNMCSSGSLCISPQDVYVRLALQARSSPVLSNADVALGKKEEGSSRSACRHPICPSPPLDTCLYPQWQHVRRTTHGPNTVQGHPARGAMGKHQGGGDPLHERRPPVFRSGSKGARTEAHAHCGCM